MQLDGIEPAQLAGVQLDHLDIVRIERFRVGGGREMHGVSPDNLEVPGQGHPLKSLLLQIVADRPDVRCMTPSITPTR